MKLITRQVMANNVAKGWSGQYFSQKKGWLKGPIKDPKEVYDRLVELGDNPNPDDVDKVIGNGTWTSVPRCDECLQRTEAVVRFGADPDEYLVSVCFDCLTKAVSLVKKNGEAHRDFG